MEKTTCGFPSNKDSGCPAEEVLKLLSGKLTSQIIRLGQHGPLRFNSLLREIDGANKQSLAHSLKELVEGGFMDKEVIKLKPLHIEYNLSERGMALIPVLQKLESFQKT